MKSSDLDIHKSWNDISKWEKARDKAIRVIDDLRERFDILLGDDEYCELQNFYIDLFLQD